VNLETYKGMCQPKTWQEKKWLCDNLDNDFFFQDKNNVGDLEVSIQNKATNYHSKWMSWKYVRDYPELIQKINSRLIAKHEVVNDIDMSKTETKTAFLERAWSIIRELKADGCEGVLYESGGKGYHIHFFITELACMKRHKVEQIKRAIIKKYGGDMMKATSRCMIQVEGVLHWSGTGRKKKMIEWTTFPKTEKVKE